MSQWKLTDLALQEIDALQNEGVKLLPIDIIRIHRLAQAVETPETQRQLARGTPVPLGSVFLRPITLAASCWLEEIAQYCKLADQPCVLAYAMVYGGDADVMLDASKQGAKKAIKWAHKLRVTPAELAYAIDEVLGDAVPIEDPRAGHGMTAGELSATLTALAGGPPEIWEYQCSIQYACEVMRCIIQNNQADDKPSMTDPRIIAERRLGLYVAGLRRKANQESA